MKEKKINKQELFLLKEHSTISEEDFNVLYEQHGVASSNQWKDFGYYTLLACGIGFFVSGVLFFFAFNWDHMPANVKFILVGSAIVCSAYFSITTRVKESINKICLIATSVLVGVLLAVFGQTYQTGANAYDLFLTWLLVVTPLTIVSQSTYQWLFFSILANTTLILAMVQRLQVDSVFVGILCLVLANFILLVLPKIKGIHRTFVIGNLYTQLQLVVVYLLATIGFGIWLFTNDANYQPKELQGALWMLLLALLIIGGGFAVGWMQKQIYLFSYALIAVVSCGLMLWMKLFKDSAEGLLIYMLYAIGAIFFIIKFVSNKSKQWKYEE
ncbi:DUF2157 domain-containing protein [Myroides sp. WP-1]|uniref:DUF2157 domain-containing protein n=1 Tax=Myroides sp. WP-1 TaxID=2759944 RepID=UPI0015FB8A22|nr:DUF2157 domain-containing protein [Myroides sp. WP-1]MBB1138046.1 DUF2157 domain-containing protein [Myroides sp. WP-1]